MFKLFHKKGKRLKNNVIAVFLLISLLTVFLGAGCTKQPSGQVESEGNDVIEIKWVDGQPAGDKFWRDSIDNYINALEEAASGKVKFTMYPAETLLAMNEIYNGVVKGVADIGMLIVGFNPGLFPMMEAIELPGIPRDPIDAGRVPWEFYEKFKPEELKDVKLLMAFGGATAGIMTTNKPVRTLEDLKGLQIRASGAGVDIMNALGATPIPMPMTDTKPALSKNIISGNFGPVGPLQTWGLAEYLKYVTFVPSMQSTTFIVFMNLDKWNSLPAEVQQALEEASKQQMEEVWYTAPTQSSLDALEWAVQEEGVTLINLSPEEEARWNDLLKGIQEDYVNELNKRGLPGEEVLQTIIELNQKYLK